MSDLDAFIAAHQSDLFAFLFRMCGDASLSEELMQETFARAVKASKHFTPKEASAKTWVYSIAVNLMRDHWRKLARRKVVPFHERNLPSAPPADVQALDLVMAAQVREALLTLPIEQREAIVLYYYHDLTYAEIAEATRRPIGTVRSRIHYGLARLKKVLERELSVDEAL